MVIDQPVRDVRQRAPLVHRHEVENLGQGRGIELDRQLAVDNQRGHVGGGHEVLEVVVGLAEVFNLVFEFLIDEGLEFVIDRLQLFLRGFELLEGRAVFLVDRLQFFIGRPEFFMPRLGAFKGALQLRLDRLEFRFHLAQIRVIRFRFRQRRFGTWRLGLGRRGFEKNHQRLSVWVWTDKELHEARLALDRRG
jgi:hypothetical protein